MYIYTKKVIYFLELYDILIILVDFLWATRLHTGSDSWYHEVEPDPDPQH